MTDVNRRSFDNDAIPLEKVTKLLYLLSPKVLEKLATKLYGWEPEEASPIVKEDHKRALTSDIIKHISSNDIVETPKRTGVKDALFGRGEFATPRYTNWHNHLTTGNANTILQKIKKKIEEFIEDPDVLKFHVGKCTADSAQEGIYNRWNTTYSRGYSGMIVAYEDTELNSALAKSRWTTRQARQIDFEKELHRTFNRHKKWYPQSTEKTGSVAESPKKTLCLYVAYESRQLGVIDWNSQHASPDNNNRPHIPPAYLRPPPTTPTKFTTEAVQVTRITSVNNSHVSTFNKELIFDTPEKHKSSATQAGPRGLVGYEGTITDLKERFDKEDIKRCKLKLLSGELNGQTIEITRFNGTSTYIQTARGDNRTCSTSNKVKVLSYG